MAFDRPVEADRVDDLGLLSSLIRAPVVGIMWLLGGDRSHDDDGPEGSPEGGPKPEASALEGDAGGGGADGEDGDASASSRDGDGEDRGRADELDGDPPGGSSTAEPSDRPVVRSEAIDEGEEEDRGRRGEDRRSSPQHWPLESPPDSVEDTPKMQNTRKCLRADAAAGFDSALPACPTVGESSTGPQSPRDCSRTEGQGDPADSSATEALDDLAAAMESSRIAAEGPAIPGPATSAVLSSQGNTTSSSTDSLSASYSASTFSNHQQHASRTPSLHSSITGGQECGASNPHPSSSSSSRPPSRADSNSSIRSGKKTSWSDECGNRSLVEYFDEDSAAVPKESKHWSAMRRNSWQRTSRHSFDAGDGGAGGGGGGPTAAGSRRGEHRVIKSALKRSGSYSPPVAYYANKGVIATSSSTDSSSSSIGSASPRASEAKSFCSLSVIGSDSSRSSSPDLLSSKGSHRSGDTDDSLAALTQTKLNSRDVVPSTLRGGGGGGGRASGAHGGLIIPRGGPTDARHYFPKGGTGCDPRYQLILGANGSAPTSAPEAQTTPGNDGGERGGPADDDAGGGGKGASCGSSPSPSPNPGFAIGPPGTRSPGSQHPFLPRPAPGGYISPQYGFYVNITPPTPELYAAAASHPHRDGKAAKSAVQQSYQQFQYQSKYKAPSPIPEGVPDGVGMPQSRFVGRSSVPRPSSHRYCSGDGDRTSEERVRSMKPTFTNNKKGMGMLLAENPHHSVWPTVPFG